MKKILTTLFVAFLSSLSAGAQPLTNQRPHRPSHHTQTLPGVNEHRLARLAEMREANLTLRHREGPWRVNTQTETKRGLVLLVEFSDTKMKEDAATQWNNRFNQQGFSEYYHVGSVRDYFLEQSYGLLSIHFDVVGPFTLSNTRNYYGSAPNSRLSDRAPEMVIEALRLADPQVNYADYDWNNDGSVDQVYVIFAGVTSSSAQGYIWPHEWNLSSAKYYGNGSGRQSMDGVYIDTYAVSNELYNSNTLEGIGTACHEFSHCLGYPDFYDTDYTGGTAGQNWDLLDGGSYNGPLRNGEIPSPYTAYERWMAGWIDLIPLTEPCRVKNLPAINEEGVAYLIKNTGNANEYYILENRQRKTFGKGNLGHGLMVWHIDYNQTIWNSNKVNSDKDHQRMTFLPADGQVGVLEEYSDGGYYYNISSQDEAGDPYPSGSDEVKPLTWFTAQKDGNKTHQNLIHDISESSDGKISFTYGEFFVLPTPEVASPTTVTPFYFTAHWQPVAGAATYKLQVQEMTGEKTPETVLSEDFSGFKSAGESALVSNSVVNRYTQTGGWSVSSVYGTNEASVRIGTTGSVGYITTPAINNSQETLIVEFDAEDYDTDGSSVSVSVLYNKQPIATQTVALTGSRATYRCTFEGIPSGCSVKFASTAAKKRFFLYNINIMDLSGTASNITTYTDLTTTSYDVETTQAEQYYYRVQAVCEDGTSRWSDWMDVDIASSIGAKHADYTREGAKPDAEWFDLSGRRIQRTLQRGLYIRNGKTYVAQ